MQEENVFKLILKRKEYLIPSDFLFFDDVDSYIHSELITKGQYIVKSKVTETVFQSFLDNWINNETPNLRIDNIFEYELLSEEFDRMKALISQFKSHISYINCSFIQKKNYTLNKDAENAKNKISKIEEKFHLIIDHLFNNQRIDSFSKFLEISADLYEACKKDDVDSVFLMTRKQFKHKNGFTFTINEQEKTAGILNFYSDENDVLKAFIPRSVYYKNEEYIITIIHRDSFKDTSFHEVIFDDDSMIKTIGKNAFHRSEIKSISIPKRVTRISKKAFHKCFHLDEVIFDEDSEVELIESETFVESPISKLTIPPSVVALREGWCFELLKLNSIIVSPNNKNFMFYDDKYLIGKSNPLKDELDVLYFARRDIEEAEIPSFIRVIGSFAFEACKSLKKVIFPKDSKLKIIERRAFSRTSIQKVLIPDGVTSICDGCFYFCKNLRNVEFSNNSMIYSISGYAFAYSQKDPQYFDEEAVDLSTFCQSLRKSKKYSSSSDDFSEPSTYQNPFLPGPQSSYNNSPSFNQNLFLPGPQSSYNNSPSFNQNLFPPGPQSSYNNSPSFNQNPFLPGPQSSYNNAPFIDQNPFLTEPQSSSNINFDSPPAHSNIFQSKIQIYPHKVPSIHKNPSLPEQNPSFNDIPSIYQDTSLLGPKTVIGNNNDFSHSNDENNLIGPHSFDHFFKSLFPSEDERSGYDGILFPRNHYKSLECLSIPSDIVDFDASWCCDTPYLTTVTILEKDIQNIKLIEGKIIVGKSDITKDDFDVILFASRDIEAVIIPSNIKRIAQYAFQSCINLQKVEFCEDSQLEVIEYLAFHETSIESLVIPPSVIEIEDYAFYKCERLCELTFLEDSKLIRIGDNAFMGSSIKNIMLPSKFARLNCRWFNGIRNLVNVLVMPNNCLLTNLDENFLVGKSAPNNSIYDVILFASRDINKALIPSFIKEISQSAFSNCNNLQKVEFSDESELKHINENAFECSSIIDITIPSSVSLIGKNAFKNCIQLRRVNFMNNSNLQVINEFTFYGTSIESITIPSKVYEIKEKAFYNCVQLKTVNFPTNSELKIIGSLSFSLSPIEQIVIPPSVFMIDNCAFMNCKNLKIVEFSQNSHLRLIGKYAFANTSIGNIYIPCHVTKIDKFAFYYCTKLENIEFAENSELCSIEENAFVHTEIEYILIPQSISSIGRNAFSFCNSLKTVEFAENSNLRFLGENPFNGSKIKSILLPGTFYGVLNQIFCNTPNLMNISIVSNAERNEETDDYLCSISWCDDKFIVGKSNQNDENFDVLVFARRDIKEGKIPPFIKTIASFAFENCFQIQTLDFSESKVELFDQSAFDKSSIKSIKIPDKTKRIGIFCFCELECFESIEISPKSKLELIGYQSFHCTSIRSIFIPSHVKEIEEMAFSKCEKLKKVEFQDNSELKIIRKESFEKIKIRSLSIPSSVEEIEENAFYGCTHMKIVEIQENSKLKKLDVDKWFGYDWSNKAILLIPPNLREYIKRNYKQSWKFSRY